MQVNAEFLVLVDDDQLKSASGQPLFANSALLQQLD